jgi:hypothetical protein
MDVARGRYGIDSMLASIERCYRQLLLTTTTR